MKQIVILGAGTAGTMLANRLVKTFSRREWGVTVIDGSEHHYYQPGFLFLPFNMIDVSEVEKVKSDYLSHDVNVVDEYVERIIPQENAVKLSNGEIVVYDVLVIATGVTIRPDMTDGMKEGWHKNVHSFYTYDDALELQKVLQNHIEGSIVVHLTEMPIKCPVAPLEFSFLVDSYFRDRGIRDEVPVRYVTPLDGAFTKPVASKTLGSMLDDRSIELVTDFGTEKVDAKNGKLISYDGREVDFNLLVTIPVNMGAEAIKESGMGDEYNLVPTNQYTLQSHDHPNVFVAGDASNIPTSKAGSVIHFEMPVLIENIQRFIEGKELRDDFDGHANCFIEAGGGRGVMIDFDYEREPLPGKFPFRWLGPFSL